MWAMSRVPGSFKTRALLVLPSIPEDAPDELKNALATRNACATEGRCPDCGTTPDLRRDPDGIYHLTFRHETDCMVNLLEDAR
jgi:hypothetical protein